MVALLAMSKRLRDAYGRRVGCDAGAQGRTGQHPTREDVGVDDGGANSQAAEQRDCFLGRIFHCHNILVGQLKGKPS